MRYANYSTTINPNTRDTRPNFVMAGLDISREKGGRESGAKGHLITADLAESVIAAGQFSASPCGSDYANRYQPVSVHRRLWVRDRCTCYLHGIARQRKLTAHGVDRPWD